ncbi:MAG: hypothetical protein GY832_24530, partial [Chloroflexi bacterium]|nr:hypothetical protein [Chloroflexota bacterium]
KAFLPAIWWVLGFAILGALLTFMAAFNLWWPLWWWVSLEHGEMYIAPALDSARHILPGWVFIVRAVAILAPLVVWLVPTLVAFMRFVDEIAWGNRRNVTTRPVDIEQIELGPFGGVRPRSKARPIVKERDTNTVYSLNHKPHTKVHEGYVTLTATETENVQRLCVLLNDKSSLSTATGKLAGWTPGAYRKFRDDTLLPRKLAVPINSQSYKLTPAGAEFLTAHGLDLTPERYAELVQRPEVNKEKNNGTT